MTLSPLHALPLLLAGLVAVPNTTPITTPSAPAQDVSSFGAQQPSSFALKPGDLELHHYTPKNAPADVLRNQAFEMRGAQYRVQAGPQSEQRWVENMSSFGSSILLYDKPEQIGDLVKLLETLEEAFHPAGADDYALREITYRHLSKDRLMQLMNSLHHGSYTVVEEQNKVILRGSKHELDDLEQVLASIDKPTPQVLLTAYLIRGSAGENSDDKLPAELVNNLSKLLPFAGFEMKSLGILRSSVESGSNMEILLNAENAMTSGTLFLNIGGHDRDKGTLNLAGCSFSGMQDLFSTSTTVSAGEYTVLGASGMDPLFVVLHFQWL